MVGDKEAPVDGFDYEANGIYIDVLPNSFAVVCVICGTFFSFDSESIMDHVTKPSLELDNVGQSKSSFEDGVEESCL